MANTCGMDQRPDDPEPKVVTAAHNAAKKLDYLRRFQLLGYREVNRLSDVMETVVPIHGTGNFPTLDIRPSVFVQLVRRRLASIGIHVHDIRLNGSAATHVLSDDIEPNYKDLDLIFTIDFPPSNFEIADVAQEGRASPNPCHEPAENGAAKRKVRPTSLPTSPRQRDSKTLPADDSSVVDDSGYTSSGSSVSSAPGSPTSASSLMQSIRERSIRLRTRSMESSASSTSSRRGVTPSLSRHDQHVIEQQHRDRCWQRIKDEVMDILLEFMPDGVSRTRMNSVLLSGAYVQKMVKVTNDSDKWSLISLKNRTGRNLELKFVQHMRRQFEFSVDSFQVVLDTYLAFCQAAKPAVDDDNARVQTSERFHATVLAESVYGDFAAAIRHLKHRRICTHRPEEIRGGGLLRYCNLRVRDYTPGDCDDAGNDVTRADHPSSSADPEAVKRLEQHMCSRFFIDFSDIGCQKRKLISYLDGHFGGEPDLKLQYLLRLRDVVGTRTVCLMQQERTLIYDLISVLVRQTMAQTVAQHDASYQVPPAFQEPIYCGSMDPGAPYYYDCPPQGPPPFMTPVVYQGPPPPPQQAVAMSDRSSPMSTYSSLAPSTHGDPCSPSPSPAPHSRPMTPSGAHVRGPYLEPQPCEYPAPQHGYPTYQPQFRRCCCCGCCCCCGGHVYEQPYQQTHGYFPQTQGPVYEQQQYASQGHSPTMAPIYYTPDTMTCFYQPAAYSKPQQA